MYKILLVEDDNKIAEILASHLKKYGYDVYLIQHFEAIKKDFLSIEPDLVLLDINLPYFDGFYWCRQIRTVSKVPIIFISARTDDMNQVMAIENGGDDYITKPFHLDIVVAKLKSAIRRSYGEYALSTHKGSAIIELGQLYIYPQKLEVEWQGTRLTLSHKEFQLLSLLINEHDRVVSRDELLEALWDEVEFVDDNTLTVNVNRVRKKLADLGLDDAIKTVRGQGYRLHTYWLGD